MTRLLLCCLLLLQCSVPILAQQPTPKPSERYKIISATITTGAGSPDQLHHVIFLLDTQTGQVWRYVEGIGGGRDLKPQDQFSLDSTSTVVAISPGGFVPVPRIELPPTAH